MVIIGMPEMRLSLNPTQHQGSNHRGSAVLG